MDVLRSSALKELSVSTSLLPVWGLSVDPALMGSQGTLGSVTVRHPIDTTSVCLILHVFPVCRY